MQLQYLVPMSLPKVLVSFCVFNPLSRLEIENEIMSTPLNKTHGSYSFSSRTLRSAKYVYSTTKGWKPYLQEKITLKREHDNVHDRFAVSGLAALRGRLAPVVVGHIPRELSRYVLYALEKGAKFTGEVLTAKAKRSPLIQGGLEIPIKVNVQWTDSRNLAVLKQRTEVSYPIGTDYTDDSKSILAEIQDEADVEIENCSSDSENEESLVEFQ